MTPKLLLRAPEGAGRDLQTGHQGRPRSVYSAERSLHSADRPFVATRAAILLDVDQASYLLVSANL
jgi:hypothetical protein